MAKKKLVRLVVDTDVLCSANYKEEPPSRSCRGFLMAISSNQLKVVVTSKSEIERRNHQSNFSRKWHLTMLRKGRVHICENEDYLKTEETILCMKDDLSFSEYSAMLKDVHLVHAARHTDGKIVSRDDVVRLLFSRASKKVNILKGIIWVNPTRDEEQPIKWLGDGAPKEKHRRLGNYHTG